MTPELLNIVVILLNAPGEPGYTPWRLVFGFLAIVVVVSGAFLFTYWISKDE